MPDFKVPSRKKKSLSTDEKKFLELWAQLGNRNKAAKQAFPNITNRALKIQRLMAHDFARHYLKEQQELALEIARQEFKYSVTQHYYRLNEQANGILPTKRINKDKGDESIIENHYDMLSATQTILKALGELSDTTINNINAQKGELIIELD